jgi:hypothetical protein
MARRFYSSIAVRTTLSSGIDDTVTSITVAAVTGFPASYPYTLIIDEDIATQEVVEVTAGAGTTLTITRGVDGSVAAAHSSGAAVNHGVSARDFDEPNAFLNAGTLPLVTAKGDILAATTSGTVDNLALGTTGYVLTADSAEATGLKWALAAAGATGGGTDQVFYENDVAVTTDYTISTDKNAMSAGPVEIEATATVTIPSGSVWSVV